MSSNMRMEIEKYCTRISLDPLLVQGAGGNISWKDGDTLWIKASGMWMADAEKKDIFVPVNLEGLNSAIRNKNFEVIPSLRIKTKLRPSIETLLHALMPHRVVVHLHAVEILANLVRHDFSAHLKNRISDTINWGFVEYCKPGPDLAREIEALIKDAPQMSVVLLGNHGVVLGGDTISEVNIVLKDLVSSLSSPVVNLDLSISLENLDLRPLSLGYLLIGDLEIQQLALNPNIFKWLSTNWALFPDHVVFLGPKPNIYESWEDFLVKKKSHQDLPKLIFIREVGVYVLPEFNATQLVQLRCYWDVISRQKIHTNINALSNNDIASLLNWNAEKFRIQMAR